MFEFIRKLKKSIIGQKFSESKMLDHIVLTDSITGKSVTIEQAYLNNKIKIYRNMMDEDDVEIQYLHRIIRAEHNEVMRRFEKSFPFSAPGED